jgi:hypothetical protein
MGAPASCGRYADIPVGCPFLENVRRMRATRLQDAGAPSRRSIVLLLRMNLRQHLLQAQRIVLQSIQHTCRFFTNRWIN